MGGKGAGRRRGRVPGAYVRMAGERNMRGKGAGVKGQARCGERLF